MPSNELNAIRAVLAAQPRALNASVAERRAAVEDITTVFPLAPDVIVTPVDAGGVPAEWIAAPGADPRRTMLYLHGGGYVICSINTHRELASRLARAAAARVLIINYRLAPEHPHPAAVEDALTAYRWLIGRGANPQRTVIAGDSAGGGLTVATLVALRDAGDALPAAAVCISPWVDLEATGESMTSKADVDPMVQREQLVEMGKLYLGDKPPRTPLASPLYADLTGLPPLLIQVGTAETLLDDSTRLAGHAIEAGVDVMLEPWEDMVHVWHIFATMLPEAREAIEHVGAFVRERT